MTSRVSIAWGACALIENAHKGRCPVAMHEKAFLAFGLTDSHILWGDRLHCPSPLSSLRKSGARGLRQRGTSPKALQFEPGEALVAPSPRSCGEKVMMRGCITDEMCVNPVARKGRRPCRS